MISEELFDRLDDLRGFRHFFRHSYGREIDPRKLRLLLETFPATSARCTEEVGRFIHYLRALLKDLDDESRPSSGSGEE